MPDLRTSSADEVDPSATVGYRASRGTVPDLELGPGARVRSGSVLYHGSRIGRNLQTGHHVVIREECAIGDDVSIWSNTVIDYGVRIGDRVKIHSNCYVAQYTIIEDDAFLAPGVTIANDLYPGQTASAEVMAGPVIGAGAQIGVNVTLLPYVHIGAGCLVGAGAVVARDLPDGCVAFGNPAVVRGRVEDLRAIEQRVRTDRDTADRHRLLAR